MTILYYLPVFIGWSLPFFWIKKLTDFYSNKEMIILIHLCWHSLILPFIIYYFFVKKKKVYNFIEKTKNLPLNVKFTTFLIAVIGIFSQIFYFKLLEKYDVSFLVPVFRSISAILILIIGYLFYNESMNLMKVFGIITILIGINLLTYSYRN